VSISSDGCWVAVMNLSGDDNSQLEVWNLSGPRKADRIARLAKRPQSLVIMQAQEKPPRRGADAGCGSVVARIALAEAASADLPVFCIEVIMVYDDGSSASAYRIRADSPCRSLRFCHGSSDMILSAHADGLVMLCDLLSGQLRVSHDDAAIRSVCTSTDRTLIVSTMADSFRVYRPAAPTSAGEH